MGPSIKIILGGLITVLAGSCLIQADLVAVGVAVIGIGIFTVMAGPVVWASCKDR